MEPSDLDAYPRHTLSRSTMRRRQLRDLSSGADGRAGSVNLTGESTVRPQPAPNDAPSRARRARLTAMAAGGFGKLVDEVRRIVVHWSDPRITDGVGVW